MNEIKNNENLPSESDKRENDNPIKQKKPSKPGIFGIMALIILTGIGTIILRYHIISSGASAFKTSYEKTYNEEHENAYNASYEKAFARSEKKHHTANKVGITIGNMKETLNLEVLNVSDIEYITDDASDLGHGITSWLEVPGEGTYTVNLKSAEFIIDSQREYVLVRAPRPEITNISIDYKNVQKVLFENDLRNDSIAIGEDLARSQLNKADLLIKKEFASNQHFYQSAKNAAILSIQCLVKELNPDVPNLTVEVEFF